MNIRNLTAIFLCILFMEIFFFFVFFVIGNFLFFFDF